MPSETCLVCASDEGIFLNIFAKDKSLRKNIEACLSIKLNKTSVSSGKICHKCAFELDKCNNFIKKYKTTDHERQNISTRQRSRYCSLCLEPGKPGYIHNLHVEKSPKAFNKIKDIFQNDFTTNGTMSICLECRYNLDVLSDLIKIYKGISSHFQDVFDGQAEISKLPKIETEVVKRKTTFVKITKIKLTSPSPSRDKNKINNSQLRRAKCEQLSPKTNQIDTINSSSDTKQCSVYLKDILTSNLKPEIDAYISLVSDDSEAEEISKNVKNTSKRTFSGPDTKNKTSKKIKKEPVADSDDNKEKDEEEEEELPRRRTRNYTTLPDYCELKQSTTKRRISESTTSDLKIEKSSKLQKISKLNTPKSITRKKSPVKNYNQDSCDDEYKKNFVNRIRGKTNSLPLSSPRSKNLSRKISEKTDSDGGNQLYTCSVCLTEYKNRIEGLTHELTHSKKLGVILEKVPVPKTSTDDKIEEQEEEKEKEKGKEKQDVSLEKKSKVDSVVDEQNQGKSIEKLDEKTDSVDDESVSLLNDEKIIEKSSDNVEDVSKNQEKLEEVAVDNEKSSPEEKKESENNDVISLIDSQEPEKPCDEEINTQTNEEVSPIIDTIAEKKLIDDADEKIQNKDENSKEKEKITKNEVTENIEKAAEEKTEEPQDDKENTESTDLKSVEEIMEKIHENSVQDEKKETTNNSDDNLVDQEKSQSELPVTDQEIPNDSKHKSSQEDAPAAEVISLDKNEETPVENKDNSNTNHTEVLQTEVSHQLDDSPVVNDIEAEKKTEDNCNIKDKETFKEKWVVERVKIPEGINLETNVDKSQNDLDNFDNNKIEKITGIRNNIPLSPKKTSIYQDISDDEFSLEAAKINTDKSTLNQPIDQLKQD